MMRQRATLKSKEEVRDMIRDAYYPAWVCGECGNKYGKGMSNDHVCTIHNDICGICGKMGPVTEPRDFGHLTGYDWVWKAIQVAEHRQ